MSRWRVGAVLGAASLAVVACAASLTPGGYRVRYTDSESAQRCQPLGEVTAVDSALGSRAAVRNHLRNEAAARGATHILVIPMVGGSGGYTTQRARAFRCGR